MATTVINAFEDFLSTIVNLHADVTKQARSSRDWLITQINWLEDNYAGFPSLYAEVNIHYGSFARRTTIRDLDDVDLLIGLRALGTTYSDYGGTVYLNVPQGTLLRDLCHDNSDRLNSRKVINRFVSALKEIPQYEKSELGREGSAAVLNLKSYSWSFDIVPAFFTVPEADSRTFYIIPDGNGHWMKTDPRIDRDRVNTINQKHEGNVLDVIRTIKYWNRRATMPSMKSYLVECIVLNYYESSTSTASGYVDIELPKVFDHITSAIYGSVNDPKNIQGNINTLPFDDRSRISARAAIDASLASAARTAEINKNEKESIRLWRQVFGSQFPDYTGS